MSLYKNFKDTFWHDNPLQGIWTGLTRVVGTILFTIYYALWAIIDAVRSAYDFSAYGITLASSDVDFSNLRKIQAFRPLKDEKPYERLHRLARERMSDSATSLASGGQSVGMFAIGAASIVSNGVNGIIVKPLLWTYKCSSGCCIKDDSVKDGDKSSSENKKTKKQNTENKKTESKEAESKEAVAASNPEAKASASTVR